MCRRWAIFSATKAPVPYSASSLWAMFLKNSSPPGCARFLHRNNLTLLDIIRRVYKEPQGNRFLASLTPFLLEHIDVPEVHALVLGSFRAFFRRNVAAYAGKCAPEANFIGSIAYYYRDVLAEAAGECGYTIGTILKSPMEGLVKFHAL